uniref:Uncharacterized protein n=1 Tax=Anguilla anguilla TaxID=7936 RepID=A0A0E9RYD3_ANGAN
MLLCWVYQNKVQL